MSNKKVKDDEMAKLLLAEMEMSTKDWMIVSIIGILCAIGLWMAIFWTMTGIIYSVEWFQNVNEEIGQIPDSFTCSIEEKNVVVGTRISCPKGKDGKWHREDCVPESITRKKTYLSNCENGNHISVPFDQ